MPSSGPGLLFRVHNIYMLNFMSSARNVLSDLPRKCGGRIGVYLDLTGKVQHFYQYLDKLLRTHHGLLDAFQAYQLAPLVGRLLV